MSCPALLVSCMDPRLAGANATQIAQVAGFEPGQFEQLYYAGPSLWMTDPHQPTDQETFWQLLETVSLAVHKINTVILVGHSNCGGFALKGAPQQPGSEKQIIIKSLLKARDAIRERHAELKVIPIFV